MKKNGLFFTFILSASIMFAQNKKVIPYDSVGAHLLSLNYRVFEWSLGFEAKYFNFKNNKSGIGPITALGLVNYENDHDITNGVYSVDGGFAKVGAALYQKFSGVAIYIGPNAVFSYSNQSIDAVFEDKIWGKYIESYSVGDFNIGVELALGFIIKVHKKAFLNLEGAMGSKFISQDNPIYKQLNISSYDVSNVPYFSPGMGRGGELFINASIGFGYQF
ncbi:MAG: hypothetical protein JHD28_01635 [Bacteroidia bacterium]|nr:hypothetical protein [Bacteroidia bacterium]